MGLLCGPISSRSRVSNAALGHRLKQFGFSAA